MAQAGSLWVKLGLTDADFVKGLKKAENDLNRFGQRLSTLGSRLTTGISLPFALAAGSAIKLGADLEQTKVSFEVMTGSAEKAAQMVRMFQEMAAKTPFETSDLLNNAKTLMLYGVEAEKVKDILSMLGDVSGGNAEKLNNLSYAFAQMYSAGRLLGQDLRQMVNAGFNPLQVMAEKTGKSMLELKKDMEDGAISSQMVVQAFKDATSEGGRFYGMMDKQSQTTAGKFSTLKDNIKIALTDIGTALLPFANRFMEMLDPITKGLKAFADWFSKLPQPIQNTIVALTGVSIAIGPVYLGIGKMIQGWSALIGIIRNLPLLGLNKIFADIGIYIGGAIKGAWSFKAALTALSASFTPFLIGGAIITGVAALVYLFIQVQKEAKLAALDMKNATDMSEITRSIQENQRLLSELRRQKQEDKEILSQSQPKDYAGAQRYALAKNRSTPEQLEKTRLLELQYGTQIQAGQERLKQLSGEMSTATTDFKIEWDNVITTLSDAAGDGKAKKTVFAAFQEYGKALEEIAAKEKLMLPGYDANAERLNALSSAIDNAIVATDANTLEGQQIINAAAESYRNMSGQVSTVNAKLDKSSNELDWLAAAANRAAGGMVSAGGIKKDLPEQATPKVVKFNDYLDQASTLLSGIQGPLADFAAGLVDAIDKIKTISENINNLSPQAIQQNTQGPLGGFGGLLGILGSISSIMGILGGFISAITGADKAAEAQQRAAEAWIKFMQEASSSQMFGKRGELEKQLEDLRKKYEEAGKMGGKVGWYLQQYYGKQINEILAKLKEIPDAIQQMLGISLQDLSSKVKDAFNATDLTEFKNKFKAGFTELMRQAMLNAWMSEQALKPLQEAIMKAFDPKSLGGSSITAAELKNLKTLWEAIGAKGTGFYELLDKLGLGMKGLETATNAATSAMLNVPEGLKVERYRYAAANPQIIASASSASPSASFNTGGLMPGTQSTNQTTVQLFLNTGVLWGELKIDMARDNVIGGGSTILQAPAYVSG